MCIIGNPPYTLSSTNKGKWMEKLLNDYKKDLKDKKGRVLEFNDIFNCSRIIVALTETHKIMQEINQITIE